MKYLILLILLTVITPAKANHEFAQKECARLLKLAGSLPVRQLVERVDIRSESASAFEYFKFDLPLSFYRKGQNGFTVDFSKDGNKLAIYSSQIHLLNEFGPQLYAYREDGSWDKASIATAPTGPYATGANFLRTERTPVVLTDRFSRSVQLIGENAEILDSLHDDHVIVSETNKSAAVFSGVASLPSPNASIQIFETQAQGFVPVGEKIKIDERLPEGAYDAVVRNAQFLDETQKALLFEKWNIYLSPTHRSIISNFIVADGKIQISDWIPPRSSGSYSDVYPLSSDSVIVTAPNPKLLRKGKSDVLLGASNERGSLKLRCVSPDKSLFAVSTETGALVIYALGLTTTRSQPRVVFQLPLGDSEKIIKLQFTTDNRVLIATNKVRIFRSKIGFQF